VHLFLGNVDSNLSSVTFIPVSLYWNTVAVLRSPEQLLLVQTKHQLQLVLIKDFLQSCLNTYFLSQLVLIIFIEIPGIAASNNSPISAASVNILIPVTVGLTLC
jgi:hypothetical protein